MSVEILEERIVDDELREIAAGRREGRVPRARAVTALARARLPDGDRLLGAVLGDETAPTSVRAVAAAGLAHVATAKAVAALTAATRGTNPAVLAAAAAGLARVGDTSALAALVDMQNRTAGPLRQLAAFAAAVIAHRLGAEGHDLQPPGDAAYVEIPSGAPRPQVDELPDEEARECVGSLREERLGIEYAERPVYRITCDRGAWMLVFNRAVLEQGALTLLPQRKLVFSVLARKRPDASGYSAGCYVLTAPADPDRLHVFVPTVTGQLYWGGTARFEGDSVRAQIRALARSGALPVDLDIRVRGNRLELLHGLFDHTIHTGREPKRG
jgi:HEAT repeats